MNTKLMMALLPLLFLASPGWAAGLDQYLIARWNVGQGSLDSEPPGMPLSGEGAGHASGGLLAVTGKTLLLTRELNASRYPKLAQGVTLWARLRFDTLPSGAAFIFGLSALDVPGNWPDMALGVVYQGDATSGALIPYATLQDGTVMSVGPSRLIPVHAGEDLTVAVVFDGTLNTLSLSVNGTVKFDQKNTATRIKDFAAFGIGHLKAVAGTGSVSFREIRAYSMAIPSEWVEEIGADDPAK